VGILGQTAIFPAQATTTASQVDALFFFLLVVCGSVGLLVAVLLIYFCIRYRRRPGDAMNPPQTHSSEALEWCWTIAPMFVFVVMFFWGAVVSFHAYRAPDEPTQVLFTSEDVIHSFFVPEFRVHMDVLPNRYTSVWFQATRPGTYHLFCSQYCGTNHAGMVGTAVVMEPAEFENWLALHAEGSMALEGRKVFLKYRCVSCHSATENARAPVLEGLYRRQVHLTTGQTLTADDAYIRESILSPGAKIVAGWENIMPTFRGQINEEEIFSLIAYFRSLSRGETPPRVEDYPPPTATPQINATSSPPKTPAP
jgi:cytochrome c oxidase subunit II